MRKLFLFLIPFALFAQGRKYDHYTMNPWTWRTVVDAKAPWWKFGTGTVKARVELPQRFIWEPSCHAIDDSETPYGESIPPITPIYDAAGRFQQLEITAPANHMIEVKCDGAVMRDKPIEKVKVRP